MDPVVHEESRVTAKFVLWGGPEDGMEVEVQSGSLQVVVDSPSVKSKEVLMPPTRQARYAWNGATKKFEWKGYK